jgi:uncharacterized protein
VTNTTFADKYGPWAVVLGASEGLGEAFAYGVAARGVNVVVAARRAEPLQRVADAVANKAAVETRAVTLDLADPAFLDSLRRVTDGLDVGLVIYNGAGSYVGEFVDQSIESMQSIVSVNCVGPVSVCEHFGRQFVAKGQGGLILMSSGAGLAGCAFNAVYAASKAFDLVLGESLWAELRGDGVDVLSVIGPAIDTPTFRASMPPEVLAVTSPPMAPADVVEEVLDALGSAPSFVPGLANREGMAALGKLPRHRQVEAMSAAHAGFARHGKA